MNRQNSLEQEFNYFLQNQNLLVEKYNHRYLVIVGEQVVGDYASLAQAVTEAAKKYEVGKFLVQLCIAGEEAYTQQFHSRVIFS